MVNHPRRSMASKLNEERDRVLRLQHALADAVFECEWLMAQIAEWEGADKSNLNRKVARWKALSSAIFASEWRAAVQEHGAPLKLS